MVLTHLDFDHCGGSTLLPRARVLVPAAPRLRPRPASGCSTQLRGEGRLEWIERARQAAARICLRPAPAIAPDTRWSRWGTDWCTWPIVDPPPACTCEHPDWDREFDSDVELAPTTACSS